jgi:DNA-binding response OmpR family regulator
MDTPTDVEVGPQRRRLLIVEDDLETRTFLELALSDFYAIETAINADQALEKANRMAIDLFLIDIALREAIDGIALMEILRSRLTFRHTPMIAMTAHQLREDRSFYLERGFDDYIGKPFYPQDLIDLIARHLRRP